MPAPGQAAQSARRTRGQCGASRRPPVLQLAVEQLREGHHIEVGHGRSSAAGQRASSRSRSRKMPRAHGSHRRALEPRDVLVGGRHLEAPDLLEDAASRCWFRLAIAASKSARRSSERRRAGPCSGPAGRRASARLLAARGGGARASPTPSRARRESAARRTSLARSAACTSSTRRAGLVRAASGELRQQPDVVGRQVVLEERQELQVEALLRRERQPRARPSLPSSARCGVRGRRPPARPARPRGRRPSPAPARCRSETVSSSRRPRCQSRNSARST